jgi:hypothetical protein
MTWQIVAAVLAYAALLESAVETFARGSPVRWWVIGIVAVYTGATALFWRRTSWQARAAMSALALIGMLAVTAWLPGGLENGVRLLGLSTSTLLSLAAAAGVALGAFVLVRSAHLPRGVHLVIALAAAYGVIAFLYGAALGVPFTSLLSGSSFWRGLPFFFQGAVAGGLIVVPAALVVAAIRLGTRHPRPGSTEHALYQVTALATTFAIAVSALPHRGTEAPSGVTDSPARRLTLLHNSLRAIEDGERELPRDRWDPDYIVATVGRHPQQLADWVRTYTYWIPYRGELRGATGVLMDGQGNSLDRAVLLATLLQKAGHTIRLAHRKLSRDQALELMPALAAIRTEAFRPAPSVPLISPDDLRRAATHYDLGADNRNASASFEGFARAAAEAKTRVADQSARLLQSIGPTEARSDWGDRFTAAVEAMRDHWWVQRFAGNRWVDLDITDAEDRLRTSITSEGEAIALDAAPEQGRSHELTIRVIAERWSPEGLTERRALEHVVRPHEVLGQPLVLQFWPMDVLLSMTAPASSKSVAASESWGVLLLTGAEVSATGVVQANGDDPDAGYKGGFGGLGGAIGNAVGVKPRPAGSLSAVWIEYEIRTPGMAPETIRRTVFDLIGPAARAASSSPALAMDDGKTRARQAGMSMRTEILPLVCRIAPEFVAHLAAQTLLGSRQLLEAVTQNAEPGVLADHFAQTSAPTVSGLYALALARTAWSRRPGVLFDERISLFTKHVYRGVSGGRPVVFEATDIVTSRSGVDLHEWDGFAARLEQGVLDANAESLIHVDHQVIGNAGAAYKASASWARIEMPDAVNRLLLPPDTRRRIQQDLSAGYVVVAPIATIPDGPNTFAGWWRIDPATGDVLGLGPHGWGESQPVGERGAQQTWSQAAMAMLRKMGVQFASVFAVSYLWCFAAMGEKKMEDEGFKLGVLRATVVASPGECMGDSLGYGVLAAVTVPLLAIAVEGSVIASRPPRPPQKPTTPPPPKPTNPPEPPKPTNPSQPPSQPPPECPDASPKATSGQMPANPALPELPPEEATVSPQANSTRMPAASGPPVQPGYGPSYMKPLSAEEFQAYQEWAEQNRAYAEREAAAAADRSRAANDAVENAKAERDATQAAYDREKASNPSSPEAQEAYVKKDDAFRKWNEAGKAANQAYLESGARSTDAWKAQRKSAYTKRIAEANRKLYEAQQAYNRTVQEFYDWQKANPTAGCGNKITPSSPFWSKWSQASSAWEAAQSEFYRQSMGPEPPPTIGESPTVPAEAPSAGPPAPPPPGAPVDPALDKTAPQPTPGDPTLQKTEPQSAGQNPALDKTQPQSAPIPPLSKTLGGASGVSIAIKKGGS